MSGDGFVRGNFRRRSVIFHWRNFPGHVGEGFVRCGCSDPHAGLQDFKCSSFVIWAAKVNTHTHRHTASNRLHTVISSS